ncbi:sporulation integral membrane protein YtvI [Caloramator quimbayensis]|uniref:Sporulation integral membrane protein YtvI n=1 Tax=Caloramator quimbayensis TaxID=1147123 RepID=A0A1T4XBZ0_9CLOT|nr:AI-2E family transporter [Caloramator quimbayensis]SKA87033.1 sporulation integral membrane protein YtvI [Caloramator quimbayensis]
MIKRNLAILKIIAVLLIVTVILKICLVFLWPFVFSILLIIIVEPFIKGFIKFGFSRKSSCILSYLIVIVLILLTAYFISNYAYKQIIEFFHNLPNIIMILSDNLKLFNNKNNSYMQIISTFENFLMTYRSKIIQTILSTLNGFIYSILIIITSLLTSIDLPKIKNKLKNIIPYEAFLITNTVINKISQIISAEIKLVLITTIETVIGLYTLGVNNALTIGIICGILDILPVVGPSLIFIPWIVYEILIKKIIFAIGLIFLYVLLQIIRQILEIKIVGNNLKLHPVTTILSLYIGILIFGVWGVIFGPFMIILLKELFNKYYEGRFRIYL